MNVKLHLFLMVIVDILTIARATVTCVLGSTYSNVSFSNVSAARSILCIMSGRSSDSGRGCGTAAHNERSSRATFTRSWLCLL